MANASKIEAIRARLERLTSLQLDEVGRLVSQLEFRNGDALPTLGQPSFDWPHAPVHRIDEGGVYIVTGGTLYKEHFFKDRDNLDMLQSKLLCLAKQWHWQLEAWSCFSNHYHFVARPEYGAGSLDTFVKQLHSQTAAELNARENAQGRTVWYNYFDTRLTYLNSYLARLNYVHQNAVHHRLVPVANQYPWCSAAWFEQTATPAQVKTIYSFRTERLSVIDDFDVV